MRIPAKKASNQSFITQLLLACGVVAPLLFLAVLLIEGAIRSGYSAWVYSVSLLALTDRGWVQTSNFLLYGCLILWFALGVRRALPSGKGSTWGPLLLGIYGLGLIIAGLFVTDPLPGYPPGTPDDLPMTLFGLVHMLGAFLGVGALTAALFVFAGRFQANASWRGWALPTRAAGILFPGLFLLTMAAELGVPAGFVQRLAVIVGWSWITCFAFKLVRMHPNER
ncbi:MAG TPA: DUF998 domain-containing protein [Ktedonobacteraceae bacterium]|jgi:hypothetical protein|nr:DUF998 domain-containing protein [Ktedonobacteraceae bacterium]